MRQKLGFALSIMLVGCIILGTRYYEIDLPLWHFLRGGKELDPTSLHLAGEFVESNLGTAENPDGSFTVRMIAQQYVFVPQCVLVPAGVPIRFRMTSADVPHSINVSGTNDFLKVMPGTVSEATFAFATPGEFDVPCNEFCGAGHFAMRAHLKVVPQSQLADLRGDERRSCDSP